MEYMYLQARKKLLSPNSVFLANLRRTSERLLYFPKIPKCRSSRSFKTLGLVNIRSFADTYSLLLLCMHRIKEIIHTFLLVDTAHTIKVQARNVSEVHRCPRLMP